jgi:hypothetical protein
MLICTRQRGRADCDFFTSQGAAAVRTLAPHGACGANIWQACRLTRPG